MKDSIIEVKNVSKFYGSVLGLNEITVDFGKGITGILGPNGAGKSTLIKAIMGQIKPNMGKITVMGERVWDNPKLNQIMGYCPEQEAFYDRMTGSEFVTYCARLNGHSRNKAGEMARKVIETVDLTKDMNRAVTGYSKGMKQRIKIAQSLVHDPEILVMDEPLAGTDPVGRIQIMELLFKLRDQGKHILVSSHVLHEVERMTENIVLINKGKLLAQGNLHKIRDSMDKFPLTVKITCEKRRELASILSKMENIISLSYAGGQNVLLVRTGDPNLFYDGFQEIILDEGIRIDSIDSPDDNLDAIFKYLVD
ncbi:MAG: ABC transporter ATP-binding protein [Thermoplasmata archaeon]|nr:ABC transporter ATP-binding protein [Thermoplasmata archaeon]